MVPAELPEKSIKGGTFMAKERTCTIAAASTVLHHDKYGVALRHKKVPSKGPMVLSVRHLKLVAFSE